MGRDIVEINGELINKVSIHAPAWGATEVWLAVSITNDVSIHAPAWGATHLPHLQQP